MSDDDDGHRGPLGQPWDAVIFGVVMILGMIGIGAGIVIWFLYY